MVTETSNHPKCRFRSQDHRALQPLHMADTLTLKTELLGSMTQTAITTHTTTIIITPPDVLCTR